jgi:microcin C transport system substrate-binding protein
MTVPQATRVRAAVAAGLFASLVAGLPSAARAADEPKPSHGIAIHGEPGYPPDFTHLDYVDPDAPKGGLVRRSAVGAFDNLNPYILKGQAAAGVSYVFETLMTGTNDEANTEYGLVAETVETPADRSWAIFRINPKARWHDGKPITPEDVIWSFETLREKGHPFYRYYFASVAKVERIGERGVKFSFAEGENRELPVIIGQLPVLPKHYWDGKEFDKTTLEPPLGSGPYRIAAVDPGRSIEIERVPDYWGADLPVNVGRYNFDRMRFEYYRDRTVERIAFTAGATDIFVENSAKEWATAYDFPAVRDGLVKVEAIPNEIPTGMQAFIFNIRRPLFADKRVRQALAYAFDFEWTNANLFYGQYERTKSYFSNSELAATGLPSAAELEILEPYRGRIPDEAFTTVYEPPSTDGTGNIRANLREAFRLLGEAGWHVKDGELRNDETGQPFTFEILLVSPAFERIVLAFVQNLERLGIEASVRTVDTTQYQNRMDEFDFDMAIGSFGQSLSPGNEQRDFWGSASAKTPGGRNLIGIEDPAIDELIDLLIAAPDREALIARTRALDRVLLWNFFVIPHYHIQTTRIAYWNKFGMPDVVPPYGIDIDAWWIDPRKAAAVAAGKATLDAE